MEPAKTIILEALRAGKNVVSANKDLIAEEGRVLLDTAQEHGKTGRIFSLRLPLPAGYRLSVR